MKIFLLVAAAQGLRRVHAGLFSGDDYGMYLFPSRFIRDRKVLSYSGGEFSIQYLDREDSAQLFMDFSLSHRHLVAKSDPETDIDLKWTKLSPLARNVEDIGERLATAILTPQKMVGANALYFLKVIEDPDLCLHYRTGSERDEDTPSLFIDRCRTGYEGNTFFILRENEIQPQQPIDTQKALAATVLSHALSQNLQLKQYINLLLLQNRTLRTGAPSQDNFVKINNTNGLQSSPQIRI